MRKLVLLAALVHALPPLSAQIQGYLFVGPDSTPGGTFNAFTAGGGVEGRLWRGLGVGADLAYLARTEYLDEGVGLLSVGPSWTFLRQSKLQPFVGGGYALGFRSGTANLGYFGGGASYWFHRRAGLRLELRNYMLSGDRFDTSFRIGVAFR